MTEWVKYKDLTPGCIVKVIGFTCIPDGETRTVDTTSSDNSSMLVIPCETGRHILDPEYDPITKQSGVVIGVTLVDLQTSSYEFH